MFFIDNLSNWVVLAQQQINFGDQHAPHSIQIKQKELLMSLWDSFKGIFAAEASFLDRLNSLMHLFTNSVTYPLFKLDSQPISLMNIIMGIVLLMVGFKYARILSHKSTIELVKVTKIDKTSEEVIKKFIYYFFIILITILVLDISHVPITVFTVVGGALAIGVGLGTQNISNDFISGLIIMIERPFKIGDVIEIDNTIGEVQQIGTRCIFLKNGENKNIMVPNSQLLKNKIINWSYHGEFIKVSSVVPVDPDAPVVLVTEILEKALLSHPDVIKEAYIPRAFLKNFDNKALNFEVIFVVNLKTADKNEILHQFHARVLEDFKKNNIRLADKKKLIIHEHSHHHEEIEEEEPEHAGDDDQ